MTILKVSTRVQRKALITLLSAKSELATQAVASGAVPERLIKRMKNRIRKGKDVNNKPFAPIKQSTRERRLRRSGGMQGTPGGKPLNHRGRLINSIQVIKQGSAAKGAKANTGLGFRIGSTATDGGFSYPALHLRGVSGKLPVRQWLGFNKDDAKSVATMVSRILQNKGVRP